MFRYLRYAVLLLVAIVLVTMALANRDPVVIKLMPDDLAAALGGSWQIGIPLFMVMFGGIVAGILIGFVWEWLREMRIRGDAKVKTREIARLERELGVMRDTKDPQKDDVLALLDNGR